MPIKKESECSRPCSGMKVVHTHLIKSFVFSACQEDKHALCLSNSIPRYIWESVSFCCCLCHKGGKT